MENERKRGTDESVPRKLLLLDICVELSYTLAQLRCRNCPSIYCDCYLICYFSHEKARLRLH